MKGFKGQAKNKEKSKTPKDDKKKKKQQSAPELPEKKNKQKIDELKVRVSARRRSCSLVWLWLEGRAFQPWPAKLRFSRDGLCFMVHGVY